MNIGAVVCKKEFSPYKLWWAILLIRNISPATRDRLKEKYLFSDRTENVMTRHFPSRKKAEEAWKWVKESSRKGDSIEVLLITDRQFGDIKHV